jgi:uncharacterized membrane protein
VNEFLKENLPKIARFKGRILGSLVGFITGLLWVFFGFWRALAFILCVMIGFYLGKKIDQQGSLRDIINKVLPPSD